MGDGDGREHGALDHAVGAAVSPEAAVGGGDGGRGGGDAADTGSSSCSDEFSDEPGYDCGPGGELIVSGARAGAKLERAAAVPLSLAAYDGQQFGNVNKYPKLEKYWSQRYRLWSKFDEGICMDEESWYSVTPELIAVHIAERLRDVPHDVVIDAFSGPGGNSIQFAKVAKRVIAVDIDPTKLAIARHNAKVYGVEHKIEYILGDYTQLLHNLEGDAVFLSPPWGGPAYNLSAYFDLEDIRLEETGVPAVACGPAAPPSDPFNGLKVFRMTRKNVSRNVMYYLPRNTLASQLTALCDPGEEVEVEENVLNRKVRAITAYYGAFTGTSKNPRRLEAHRVPVPYAMTHVTPSAKRQKRWY